MHCSFYLDCCLETHLKIEVIVTDVCVPISALPKVIIDTKKKSMNFNLTCENNSRLFENFSIYYIFHAGPIIGHAGDGNFHAMIVTSRNDDSEYQKALELSTNIIKYAVRWL